MCTVIVLLRPGHAWPLLFAANRDERVDRAWDDPGPHWPDRPGVIGGRDRLGDGTWMAMRGGVIAAVLNRPGSLGPLAGKRSRGELPLLALEHDSAAEAAEALGGLNAAAYRTFNMVVADAEGAWFVRGAGAGRPAVRGLDPGLSVITAHDPNDPASPRARTHLPHFQAAHAARAGSAASGRPGSSCSATGPARAGRRSTCPPRAGSARCARRWPPWRRGGRRFGCSRPGRRTRRRSGR